MADTKMIGAQGGNQPIGQSQPLGNQELVDILPADLSVTGKSAQRQRLVFKGISSGEFRISSGKVYVLDTPETTVKKVRVSPKDVEKEVQRIEKLKYELANQPIPEITADFGSYLIHNFKKDVLEYAIKVLRGDSTVLSEARELEGFYNGRIILTNLVQDGHMCAEWAIEHAGLIMAGKLEKQAFGGKTKSEDYIDFIKTAARECWQALMGINEKERIRGFMSALTEPTYFVGHDIGPSLSASILANDDRGMVRGFGIEKGGVLSHLFIICGDNQRSAVVGAKGLFNRVQTGGDIIVDDHTGDIILNPNDDDKEYFRQKQLWYDGINTLLEDYKTTTAYTTGDDATRISFGANVELPHQAKVAAKAGADGIRLFRTEYLYHDLDPDAIVKDGFYEELYKTRVADYSQAIEDYEGNCSILEFKKSRFYIRVPDIKEDKPHHFIMPLLGKDGERLLKDGGIRLLLEARDRRTSQPELLITEMMAILAVSVNHPVSILLPMVNEARDMNEARECFEEAKRRLDKVGTSYSEDVKISAMFETRKSIENAAEIFYAGADTGSIGTNDLFQDLVGTNRDTTTHRSHPRVLKAIQSLSQHAKKAGKALTVCGEAAADPLLIEALIGSGIHRFSVGPPKLPIAKMLVTNTDMTTCEQIGANGTTTTGPEALETYVRLQSNAVRIVEENLARVMPKKFELRNFEPTKLEMVAV
jgi:phosphotransferase system enzyme I (PtsI)